MSKHRSEPRRLGKKPERARRATQSVVAPPPVREPVREPAPKPAPTPVAKPTPKPAKAPKPPKPPKPARPVSRPASRPAASRPGGTTAATYGNPTSARMILVVGALVAIVFLVWVAWAAWFHATPSVKSQLIQYEFNGDHLAVVHVDVTLDAGVAADCVVQALAEDHSIVGEAHFSPVNGANTVEVRTERLATAINLVGCTAAGQGQPQ